MLKLHVLVHGTFRAIRLVTALDGASIVPLDLGCSPSMSFPLIVHVVSYIVPLIVGNSLIRLAHIGLHLWSAILVETLS